MTAARADNSILQRIGRRKREEVAERMARRPMNALREAIAATGPVRDFSAALQERSRAVPSPDSRAMRAICEIKRRSPSKGVLRLDLDPADIARRYEAAGAAALSVLTDLDFFGGSDSDLQAARAAVGLPVLRKDFTVDAYQIHEARAIGADAVLLIVRMLSDAQLREFLALAGELRLAALVEVHDAGELERALACGAAIIGVNNRNLDTFEVSLQTSLDLIGRMRGGAAIAVSESGIHTCGDVQRLQAAGFDAVLVGESLMTSPDPGAKLRELLARSDGLLPYGRGSDQKGSGWGKPGSDRLEGAR